MNFNGKVVLVTGASSGIGAAIAIKFSELGATVAIVGRNEAKLKNIAKKCAEMGSKPLSIIADVTKDADVKKIVSTTVEQLKKIDVLINNAGILGHVSIDDNNAMEVYDKVMATNLRSVVYMTHLAAPYLIESKGNIVNISSIAALSVVSPGYFAYCTSKAGLDHLSRSVANDLAPKGVRVNTVNPGPVKTDIFDNLGVRSDDLEKLWKDMLPLTALGRVSEPEEISDLVLFLASDKAKAITGSSFVCDNGMLLKSDSSVYNKM